MLSCVGNAPQQSQALVGQCHRTWEGRRELGGTA